VKDAYKASRELMKNNREKDGQGDMWSSELFKNIKIDACLDRGD
jgi:hypothetical protein